MDHLLRFAYRHRLMVLFGVVLTFFSSFGQTFLISLYIPEIESVFGLSNTALSSLYAVATVGSSLTLPWIGSLIDYWRLKKFVTLVIVGYAIACLVLSAAIHPIMVLLGFFGLRLFGQGLSSHTAISTMARFFEHNRGKAISLATLGHPLSEASLPLVVSFLILTLGWRASLQISSVALILLVLPLLFWLLARQPEEILNPGGSSPAHATPPKNPFSIMGKSIFWVIAPTVFVLGFLNTAIFFFQIKLGDSRGWEPSSIAGSLTVYAAVNAISMLGSGPVVDKWKAKRLFPYILLPYIMGVLFLAIGSHPLTYPAALAFIGFANGAGSTIRNALYAEVFGVELIGTVRSVYTTVIVFSTALGPLSFGLLLDGGWTYGAIFLASAILLAIIMAWSFKLKAYT